MEEGKVIIVIGGNFGSEGKGRHVEVITRNRTHGKIDVAVRTGAPNAGHTIHHDGKKFAMQQIPCSWIDPDTKLILGAGAQIDPNILLNEIEAISPYLSGRPIYIDKNAIIQDKSCMMKEQDLNMHARMGSTAEGCGIALQRRVARDGSIMTMKDVINGRTDEEINWMEDEEEFRLLEGLLMRGIIEVVDTAELLNNEYDLGKTILLEGTQGAGLSLYHTPDYPYCTSRDTNAANWMAEAGLSPNLNTEIHLVMRLFPIRVAGNSGFLPSEMTWPEFLVRKNSGVSGETIEALQKAIELTQVNVDAGVVIPNLLITEALKLLTDKQREEVMPHIEITTVTKRVRRIAKMDVDFYSKYLKINRPDVICLQFVDYANRANCERLLYIKDNQDLIEMDNKQIRDLLDPETITVIKRLEEYGFVQYLGIGSKSTIKLTERLND